MTSESPLDKFVQAVVYDHMTATGLKKCTNHVEIVEFASSIDYCFTMSEWQTILKRFFYFTSSARVNTIVRSTALVLGFSADFVLASHAYGRGLVFCLCCYCVAIIEEL